MGGRGDCHLHRLMSLVLQMMMCEESCAVVIALGRGIDVGESEGSRFTQCTSMIQHIFVFI